MTAARTKPSWKTTELEWRPAAGEIYVVARAYGGDDQWSATYFGVDVVAIDTIDDEDEPIWWGNITDARLACEAHRLRMEAGDTPEEAALCVRVSTPKELEMDLGLYEPQAAEE